MTDDGVATNISNLGMNGGNATKAEATVFYFSSAGNCLWVAREIASRIGASSVSMNVPWTGQVNCESEVVGFVFPVYYHGVPPNVEEFIANLQLPSVKYVFAVATFGGTMGRALVHMDEIIARKGLSLDAGWSIRMPGNYQILYPPFPEALRQKMFDSAAASVEGISHRIAAREKARPRVPLLLSLFSKLFHWLYRQTLPIFSRMFSASDKCTSCGLCTRLCPRACITLSGGRPRWGEGCVTCLACMQWCPSNAIRNVFTTRLWGVYRHPLARSRDILPLPQPK